MALPDPRNDASLHRTSTLAPRRRFTLMARGQNDDPHRVVKPHEREYSRDQGYLANDISTTKYTILTIIPKNLFEQFHRLANVYFLFIVVLNWLPMIQAFGREIAMLPLLFVLAVTFVKDAYEDRRRGKQDKETNARLARVWDAGQKHWETVEWSNIEVGDLVELAQNDIIPADLLLLDTSHADHICFLETANLDGETNLKQRRLFEEREEDYVFDPAKFSSKLECELPNNKIYQFNGTLFHNGRKLALDTNNMLLRGCVLRNTKRAIGMVVYAGHDTKSMLNNTGPRSKRSKLEKAMNYQILYCCLILVVMCVGGGVGAAVWKSERDWRNILYIPDNRDNYPPGEEGVIRVFTFFIILQVMVPISLYVSIELVKLVQVYFIQEDKDLVYTDPVTKKSHKMMCRALNITEDLGQIEYVFSDKTGTLTQNKMIFHECSIAGKLYEHPVDDPTITYADARSFPKDDNLLADLAKDDQFFQRDSDLHKFMLSLAVNNTVVPNEEDGELKHEAESPDEAALVAAAYVYDYVLQGRTTDRVHLIIKGVECDVRVLNTLEFDSTRKRMSVIVRLPNGTIRMLVKGADSAIYDVLKEDTNQELKTSTTAHLSHFAKAGLRTLCFAYKDLEEKEYEEWLLTFNAANEDLDNRKARLKQCYTAIETDLTLLGATGIEDKLQDGVPDAIATLRQAGLKVWVLTGDKQETAIEIAYTCKLIDNSQLVIKLNSPKALLSYSKAKNKANARAHEEARDETLGIINTKLDEIAATAGRQSIALVVDGATLSYAMREEVYLRFLMLTKHCETVVACRTAPLQKAEIVRLVKETMEVMTLAIGDGANDVSMIQMAQVGIGISGQEGMQAVMASDFAFGQFRFLVKLLLIHGHWSYDRIAQLILFFYYKNASLVYVLFYFQFFCGFTGQPHIEQMYLQTYNLLWTSLPPIVIGIFDQDVPEALLHSMPFLYEQGRKDLSYRDKFWPVMADALYQSTILFFIPYGVYYQTLHHEGILVFGTVCIYGVIIANLLQAAILTRHWIWIHVAAMAFSFFGLLAFSFLYNSLLLETPLVPDPYFVMQETAADGRFWLTVIIAPTLAIMPRFLTMFYHRWWTPTQSQLHRQQEIYRQRRVEPLPWWLGCCAPLQNLFDACLHEEESNHALRSPILQQTNIQRSQPEAVNLDYAAYDK
eukprot:TRINITY_DN9220_c0_g1_i1.p1 TRINITY_DN9220_c0_g1~~TRINITY_DN9220_c0_g1_i1.p1  ORF type:complete len:1173 (+),score=384.81 TRINITY_DN9220_c0_g1_i1:188-3706(+)